MTPTPATRDEVVAWLINEVDLFREEAEDLLAKLPTAGLRIVPVEATEEIMDAINTARNAPRDSGEIWDEALAASPYKPETEANG